MKKAHVVVMYDPNTLNEAEADYKVAQASVSLRHLLRDMIGHPEECGIHEGRGCDHE